MTKKVSGRCLNIGNCGIANSMSIVEVDESAEFICSECGKTLVANQAAKKTRSKSTPILIGADINIDSINLYISLGLA